MKTIEDKIPFREFHILRILENYQIKKIPLDCFLRFYFKENKSIGSKDRKEICDLLYFIIRWQGLIDYFCIKPITWKKRIEKAKTIKPFDFQDDETIPFHKRMSFPLWYIQLLKKHYSKDKVKEVCLTNNTTAPTTIRVNSLKISRDELFSRWKNIYKIEKCQLSENGIIFKKKINFFATNEFKEGLFEIQDEGSQLVANLIDTEAKDQILDFCAGSGGKTLALGARKKNKGQIYLHDIRKKALLEAKKRIKRSGIENAQIILPENIHRLKKKMDWIILDVPCSGSGTFRRNPDMKWKFQPEMLKSLVNEQRLIFKKSLQFLKPKGKILYITCSILPEENFLQVEYFIRQFPVFLIDKPSFWFPQKNGRDGFFASLFQLK